MLGRCVLHFEWWDRDKTTIAVDENSELLANNRTICVSLANGVCIQLIIFDTNRFFAARTHKMETKTIPTIDQKKSWYFRKQNGGIALRHLKLKMTAFPTNKQKTKKKKEGKMCRRNPAVVRRKMVKTALSAIKANEFTWVDLSLLIQFLGEEIRRCHHLAHHVHEQWPIYLVVDFLWAQQSFLLRNGRMCWQRDTA